MANQKNTLTVTLSVTGLEKKSKMIITTHQDVPEGFVEISFVGGGDTYLCEIQPLHSALTAFSNLIKVK